MPRATATLGTTERKELKSLEGAFVELRQMNYGQVVERRALMKLTLQASGRGNSKKDAVAEMAMASTDIAMYGFSHCIVDHNLEKEDGTKLNLSNPVDFNALDPRIGTEIELLIDQMNNFEEEDDQGE